MHNPSQDREANSDSGEMNEIFTPTKIYSPMTVSELAAVAQGAAL